MVSYFPVLDFLHKVVSSSKPREEVGTYWGYKVRYASNISSVFKECPFKVLKISMCVMYMFQSAPHDSMFLRAIHDLFFLIRSSATFSNISIYRVVMII